VCDLQRPRTPVSGAPRPPARRPSTSPRRGHRAATARRHRRRRDWPGAGQQVTLDGGIGLPDHVGAGHGSPPSLAGGCAGFSWRRVPLGSRDALLSCAGGLELGATLPLRKCRERFSNLAVTATATWRIRACCTGRQAGGVPQFDLRWGCSRAVALMSLRAGDWGPL